MRRIWANFRARRPSELWRRLEGEGLGAHGRSSLHLVLGRARSKRASKLDRRWRLGADSRFVRKRSVLRLREV
jgi:hypothetical protein